MDGSLSENPGLEKRLTEEALYLLDNDGVDAVTIREVARRAAVSHGAPRRYFTSRSQLLAAVAQHCTSDLTDTVAELNAPDMAQNVIAYAESHPNRFSLLTRHDLLEGSGLNLRSQTLPLIDSWIAAYLDAIPHGTRTSAIAAFAGILGLAELASHRGLDLLEEPVPALIDAVIHGPVKR
ncbi:MAG TPA: TetR/AcrR family transcriptional regulator [Candidatus Corynebacterium avicola]|uniref:TetR/AcrR family transcriptional regulator n=1 Tax=Candidatus Corynebacterium avicola TaxID=2838527 RepID=A0A9D1RN62_9CORY|nr:TetR/AcrR family transcriptional regulator [Candidatus Corynebacterium avicola]